MRGESQHGKCSERVWHVVSVHWMFAVTMLFVFLHGNVCFVRASSVLNGFHLALQVRALPSPPCALTRQTGVAWTTSAVLACGFRLGFAPCGALAGDWREQGEWVWGVCSSRSLPGGVTSGWLCPWLKVTGPVRWPLHKLSIQAPLTTSSLCLLKPSAGHCDHPLLFPYTLPTP